MSESTTFIRQRRSSNMFLKIAKIQIVTISSFNSRALAELVINHSETNKGALSRPCSCLVVLSKEKQTDPSPWVTFLPPAFAFQCFAVRSLGWVEMAEEDLAPGKSSVAVNNCIRQLSYCKNDIRDTVGIWGEVSHPWKGSSYFPVFCHASLNPGLCETS